MAHTRASQTYRDTRIPGHPAQMLAIARVVGYLVTRYGEASERRHGTRVIAAVRAVEEEVRGGSKYRRISDFISAHNYVSCYSDKARR